MSGEGIRDSGTGRVIELMRTVNMFFFFSNKTQRRLLVGALLGLRTV